jgi:hypothetical protein
MVLLVITKGDPLGAGGCSRYLSQVFKADTYRILMVLTGLVGAPGRINACTCANAMPPPPPPAHERNHQP